MQKIAMYDGIKNRIKNDKKLRAYLAAAGAAIIALSVWLIAYAIYTAVALDKERSAMSLTDAGCIYYNSLSYREQTLYDALSAAIDANDTLTGRLHGSYDSVQLERVIDALRADRTELFHVDFGGITLYRGIFDTSARIEYLAEPYEAELMLRQLESVRSEALDSIPDAADEFSVELSLYDYLIDSCTAADGNDDNIDERLYHTAYGALVLGRAYSDGYAMALTYLLKGARILSFPVYGDTSVGAHVWNMVMLDSEFYHADAAYDDADFEFAPELRFHCYFNLGDDAMLSDREPTYPSMLPKAADGADYYESFGKSAGNADELETLAAHLVSEAASADIGYIELKTDFECEGSTLQTVLLDAIAACNDASQGRTLRPLFRIYEVSSSGAVTVQLFFEEPESEENNTDNTDTGENNNG